MKMFNRDIIKDIEPFLERREAILVRGMRRVGKTTLLKLIEKKLKKEYGVTEKQIYFFDLEDLDLREDFNISPRNLLKYLKIDKRKKTYVFLDEIQYLDNPANFLKILVDHYPKLKFFVTGSSSLEIKRKIQDSLVGRVMYFQLYPLNFLEALFFQGKNKLQVTNRMTPAQIKNSNKLLQDYLVFGGMPEVVLEENIEVKKKLLKSYLNLYISKDIRNLAEIKNLSVFNKLTKVLASQIGNIFIKTDVANRLDASLKIIQRYFDILKHTFLVVSLPPYFSNTISQLVKFKKIYFYDLGLRNALLNDFNELEFRADSGAVFENFIFLELAHKYDLTEISYYRTQQGSEIDFIVDSHKNKMAIEVKYKKFRDKKIFKVFDNFSEFDNFIVNRTFNLNLKNYNFIDWRNFLKKVYEEVK